jgi:hypothetical protein
MKKTLNSHSLIMYSVTCIMVAILMTGSAITAQSFKMFGVSDLERVFEDGYKLPSMYDTIKIFGIRGEVISGQLTINAKKSLTNVTLEVSALKNQANGNSLLTKNVSWNFVGSIPLTKNTPNQPRSAVSRTAPARFPEYLMNEKQLDIKEKSWQSAWLTVQIPVDVGAGTYIGKVTVKSNQGEQSLPVYLTVYPLTLPEKRNLKVIEWYSTDFAKFHGIKDQYSDEWFAMLRKYAGNMAEHRQNVFQVPMETIEIKKSKTGELEFDFTRYDQIAQVFWDTKKMDYMTSGELTKFGKNGWSGTEILLNDFSVKNADTGEIIKIPGNEVIPFLLPAFESHLRQKDWLGKTLFGIKDEPSLHNALAWREVSSYIHQYAPDLKRMDAIETTDLLDDIEVAVPKLDAFGTWYNAYKMAQQKGVEIWFYTVGIYQGSLFPNKTIDMPVMENPIRNKG